MSNRKEVEIENMLTPDMAKAMDLLAYGFLKAQGYETDGCEEKNTKGAKARKMLERALQRDNRYLMYHLPCKENLIFCYFTLHEKKTDEEIAKSKGIKFVCEKVDI